jgi:hypothetical protein
MRTRRTDNCTNFAKVSLNLALNPLPNRNFTLNLNPPRGLAVAVASGRQDESKIRIKSKIRKMIKIKSKIKIKIDQSSSRRPFL